jgi:hypothetical protein
VSGALFDLDPVPGAPDPDPDEDLSAGQRLRRRQAARIVAGQHPLAYGGRWLPLHEHAERVLENDGGRDEPYRCGTCVHRVVLGHHNRAYGKCARGGDLDRPSTWPMASHSEASDVRAWWPACMQWRTRPEGADQ